MSSIHEYMPYDHAAAVAIFERTVGFAWTEDYEGSREWSEAVIAASMPQYTTKETK